MSSFFFLLIQSLPFPACMAPRLSLPSHGAFVESRRLFRFSCPSPSSFPFCPIMVFFPMADARMWQHPVRYSFFFAVRSWSRERTIFRCCATRMSLPFFPSSLRETDRVVRRLSCFGQVNFLLLSKPLSFLFMLSGETLSCPSGLHR